MIFKIDEQLEFRPLSVDDIPAIKELCTHAVMKFMNKDSISSENLTKRIDDSLIPTEFSIFKSNKLIGGFVFGPALGEFHIVEIGFWLAESSQNQGIMSICLPAFIERVILGWFIRDLGNHGICRIQAHTLAENTASVKLLTKSGFRNKVVLKDSFFKDGKLYDEILLGTHLPMLPPNPELRIKITDSILLRRLIPTDRDSLHQSINHQEVLEFSRMPMIYTLDMAAEWIGRHCSPSTTHLAIVHDSGKSERVIGMIGIVPKFGSGRYSAELGYWLTPEFKGAGLMSKTVEMFLTLFVNDLYINCWGKRLRRIFASVRSDNIASRKVLDKNGFEVEGIIEAGILKNGKIYDEIVYAKFI